jgi:hypothetical protein
MAWNRQTPLDNGVTVNPNASAALVTPPTKPLIAIGVPYTENLSMWCAMKTIAPAIMQPLPWCDKIAKMSRGLPVSVNRDTIVKMVLDDPKITHIMWIDTDMICDTPADVNEAMRMLYECNQPIVSGIYRAKQPSGFNWAAWVNVDPSTPGGAPISFPPGEEGKPAPNWFQVDLIGMGFCLVKREVYEKLSPPWYPWIKQSPSEDFNFCTAARAAGYFINVFTGVKLSHIGQLVVHPDGQITTMEW